MRRFSSLENTYSGLAQILPRLLLETDPLCIRATLSRLREARSREINEGTYGEQLATNPTSFIDNIPWSHLFFDQLRATLPLSPVSLYHAWPLGVMVGYLCQWAFGFEVLREQGKGVMGVARTLNPQVNPPVVGQHL